MAVILTIARRDVCDEKDERMHRGRGKAGKRGSGAKDATVMNEMLLTTY